MREKSEVITFRVDNQTKTALQIIADEEQRTVSQIVGMIVKYHLSEGDELPTEKYLKKKKMARRTGTGG